MYKRIVLVNVVTKKSDRLQLNGLIKSTTGEIICLSNSVLFICGGYYGDRVLN